MTLYASGRFASLPEETAAHVIAFVVCFALWGVHPARARANNDEAIGRACDGSKPLLPTTGEERSALEARRQGPQPGRS